MWYIVFEIFCEAGQTAHKALAKFFLPAAKTKQEIATALLNMNKSPKWQKELATFNVWGFKEIDDSMYQEQVELMKSVKGMTIRPAYYWTCWKLLLDCTLKTCSALDRILSTPLSVAWESSWFGSSFLIQKHFSKKDVVEKQMAFHGGEGLPDEEVSYA